MSYARFGPESSVYVIDTSRDEVPRLECVACLLAPLDEDGEPIWLTAEAPSAMVVHLEKHRAVGHRVPDRAFKRIETLNASVAEMD